mgnify:CR=1 FL=1
MTKKIGLKKFMVKKSRDNMNVYTAIPNREHCQKIRILFIEVSKYVCQFNSLGDHVYLAKAIIKEKI